MPTRTAWVKKPYHTKGLDPLGVQAPSINIYTQLLPGITNVTDRARYYSFYPWVVWAYNQADSKRTHDDFILWLRRADCLFTLVAIRHRITQRGDDHLLHDAGLIGTQTLRRVVADLGDDDEIALSDFTTLEEGDANRYFKNPLGGLGQYYLGTLAALGLMGRQGREVGYTNLGVRLAEAMDSSVNRELFAEAIRSDRVNAQILDQLAAFCPCGLSDSVAERNLLLDLFFNRESVYGLDGDVRRDSLRLLFHLISSLVTRDSEGGPAFDQYTFRSACYSGALPDGRPWILPEGLDHARRGWAVYQGNELLSLAAQCVFWVVLRTLEETLPAVHSTEDLTSWFKGTDWVARAVRELDSDTFSSALARVRKELPERGKHDQPAHELSLAEELRLAVAGGETSSYPSVLSLSAQILLSLIARDDHTGDPYEPLAFPGDYFSLYPINLHSLRKHAGTTWRNLPIPEWFGWLADSWGVGAHLRVALRKLRQQSQDTFHVAPTDHGLRVFALPDPTYTSPRFYASVQILQDLGGLDRAVDGSWTKTTALGQELRDQDYG